ncbi:MAG: hypothetical protein RBR09_12095 [Desulfobulbaceae bacterium]|jgi:hypothetical protein|nr:hypothetical protein [Desulfobulbaceae bacterium]
MYKKLSGNSVRTVLLAASLAAAPFFAFPAHGEEPGADVCSFIPDEEVALAVKGRVLDSKAYDDKCVYIVAFEDESLPRRTFVVYRHGADAYDGLRGALEGKVDNVEGLGDEAVMSYDEESMRYWLLVNNRGKVTFQVSGDDPETVRRLAEVVLPRLGAKE